MVLSVNTSSCSSSSSSCSSRSRTTTIDHRNVPSTPPSHNHHNHQQAPTTSPVPPPPIKPFHCIYCKCYEKRTIIVLSIQIFLYIRFFYSFILEPPQSQPQSLVIQTRSRYHRHHRHHHRWYMMFTPFIVVDAIRWNTPVNMIRHHLVKYSFHHHHQYNYYLGHNSKYLSSLFTCNDGVLSPSSWSMSNIRRRRRMWLTCHVMNQVPPRNNNNSNIILSGTRWTSTITSMQRRRPYMTQSSLLFSTNAFDDNELETHTTTIPPPPPSSSAMTKSVGTTEPSSMIEPPLPSYPWREQPCINPIIQFPTWICYDGKNIQSILQSPILQPYLATQWDVAQHLRVRLKVIRKYHEVVAAPISSGDHPSPPTIPTPPKHVEQAKFIVLHPDTPKISNLPIDVQTILQQMKCHDTDDILPAPFVIQFQYHQFTASYLLNQLLPPKVHPVPTAFETVGHVAHLNLKPHHLPYRIMIGEILYETLPNIETVIQKIGDVSGPYRTFHYEVLAGKHNHTYVKLTENGVHLQFDIQHVYWCSRLAEERQRLLQQEIFAFDPTPTLPPHAVKNKYISSSSCTLRLQCHKPTVIADVFCGVGALCIQAALVHSPNVEIWANDWNPHATDALQKNAIRNGVIHQFTRITTIDAYQFLMDLGMMTPSPPASSSIPPAPSEPNTVPPTDTDIKMAHSENEPDQSTPKSHKVHARRRYHRKKDLRTDVVNHSSRLDGKIRLPDHVVMNFPLMAPSFLGALRWWPANACGDGNHDNQSLMNDDVHTTHRNGLVQPRIHVYTFAKNSVSSSSGSTGSNANLYDDAEDDDDPGNDVGIIGRSVEDIAVDLVAENLLPQLSPNQAVAGTLDNTSIQHPPNRRQELNDIYHCNVRTHIVRDVAPGKVVVCVSFTVTSKLLRHMRGDFL